MLSYVKNFLMYSFSRIYNSPIVKNVFKISLMVNSFDRTIEYYTNMLTIDENIEENHVMEFYFNKNEYALPCRNPEDYKNAMKYLKGNFIKVEDRLLYALEVENDNYKDITNIVRKFYGPEKNFYNSQTFGVKKSDITEHILYIIDNKFDVTCFNQDDQLLYI